MQRVLDAAHGRGIRAILRAPTSATPPCLRHSYPEVLGEGRPQATSPRCDDRPIDLAHPTFRFHAERVLRRLLGRYAGHAAVIGFQVENQLPSDLLHSAAVFNRVLRWLKYRAPLPRIPGWGERRLLPWRVMSHGV